MHANHYPAAPIGQRKRFWSRPTGSHRPRLPKPYWRPISETGKVEVLLDRSQKREKYSSAEFIAHAGIRVLIDDHTPLPPIKS